MTKSLGRYGFIWKAIQVHGYKYDYREVSYRNNRTNVRIISDEHGAFEMTPSNHLAGQDHPDERYRKSSKKQIRSLEEFIRMAKEIHGDKYDYSNVVYKGSKRKVCVICPRHGEFWQTPYCHLYGYGCKKCTDKMKSEKMKRTLEEFISEAQRIHQNLDGTPKYDYALVEYKGAKKKVKIICPVHGVFSITPDAHLNQHQGCPKCKRSWFEKSVEKLLIKSHVDYTTQQSFEWLRYKKPLRLDFYVPCCKVAIECQGEQHFKPVGFFGGEKKFNEVSKRDAEKKRLCEEHGIELLYINWSDSDEEIVSKLESVTSRCQDEA